MEQEYRILIVEDLPSDAMLVEYELKKALQRFTVQIVENESDYLKGLEEFKPDLIISDYQLPGFNGLTALKIAIEKSPLTPVIIATGSMNEETAVQCMKAGASDYVIKEHLRRLGPAVISALDQKKIKSEKILAESALREKEEELRKSEERYRTVSRLSSEFAYTCITDNKGGYKVDWITDAFFSLTGYSESELKEQGCWMFVTHPDDREMATKPLRELNPGETDKKEFRILTREGVILYIINYLECMTDPHLRDGKRLYGAVTDITERKRAENKISQVTENWNKTFDAIQDGISLIDENHHIIQSNKSFLEFVKRSPADLQEKNCFFMVHGTLCPIQGCPFVRMKHSRKRESMEMSVNGLVCEIMVDPIFDETGNITGAVHILKNITESKKTERIKQVLFDISNAVVTTHDVEELIGIIREQLGKLVDTSNFYVAFYDEATGILSSPYVQDEKDGITTWPAAMSLTGCVIEQDKPILLTMEEIQDMANKGIIEMIGVPSACWLGVPLRIDGKVIGAFVVQSYDNPQAYSENDKEMLEFVSDQISLSIQRKRTELVLIAAKDKAQESDRLKSTFLANMSHEIRTPMNAVVGFAGMINDPELSAQDRKQFSSIIQSRSDDLLHIINDILEISRIESGNATIVKGEVNLNRMLAEIGIVTTQKMKRVGKAHIDFLCEIKESAEEITFISDPYIVKQVFTNLIDNAIKYTNSGSISYGFRVPGNGKITCFVSDTGIGISPVDQTLIFEHFRQAEVPEQHQHNGTGLGLSICKGSLALLGGEIWVESSLGEGSTFYFTIPYEQAPVKRQHADPKPNNPEAETTYNWSGKTILLVEDEVTNMEFLQIILGRTNATLLTAYNADHVKSLYDHLDNIDLVLLDIRLPDVNGWDLVRIIKKLRPGLPVIAQTAYAMSTDRRKSQEAGCDNYISKPIKREQLLNLMAEYLEK